MMDREQQLERGPYRYIVAAGGASLTAPLTAPQDGGLGWRVPRYDENGRKPSTAWSQHAAIRHCGKAVPVHVSLADLGSGGSCRCHIVPSCTPLPPQGHQSANHVAIRRESDLRG